MLKKLELSELVVSDVPTKAPLALSGKLLEQLIVQNSGANMSLAVQLPALKVLRESCLLFVETQQVILRSFANVRSLELTLEHQNQLQPALEQTPQLEKLTAHIRQQPTDALVLQLAQHCTRLQELTMGYEQSLTQLTDQALLALAQGCKGLRKLNLGIVDHLTHSGVEAIGRSCSQLTHLNIQPFPGGEAGCVLNDHVLAQFHRCKQLQELSLQSWDGFTMNGFKSAVGEWPSIIKLYLKHCDGLKDTAALLCALASGARRLSELVLEGGKLNPEEGSQAANQMVACGMNLASIRIYAGDPLTEEMILIFLRGMANMKEFTPPFHLLDKGQLAIDWRAAYHIR